MDSAAAAGLLSPATASSLDPRILLCDDDPVRLQLVADQLSLFHTGGNAIETVSPRAGFMAAICSAAEFPPVVVFFVNVGCAGVEPSSVCGVIEEGPAGRGYAPHLDSSRVQLFQVCHISCDQLVAADTINALRYVFTMTPAVLEIALCVLDTVAKYTVHSLERALILYDSPSPVVPKLCISRRSGAALPRVRFVNIAFESCFGHPASWICGRSVTVLCGLLTSSQDMLRLCAEVDGNIALSWRNAFPSQQQQQLQEGTTGGMEVVLYTAGGKAIQVRASVSALPNLSADTNKESVAVLVLDT